LLELGQRTARRRPFHRIHAPTVPELILQEKPAALKVPAPRVPRVFLLHSPDVDIRLLYEILLQVLIRSQVKNNST
jgi:hypothetical protein